MKNKLHSIVGLISIAVIIAATTLVFVESPFGHGNEKFSTQYNKAVAKEIRASVLNLVAQDRYKCCMEEPCTRCFSKPGHQDEELVCECLVDLMNGKHPCGECIGEILEGEGNPLLSEYFATAIAEKLGEEHLDTLKEIIFEQYGMPIDQQI